MSKREPPYVLRALEAVRKSPNGTAVVEPSPSGPQPLTDDETDAYNRTHDESRCSPKDAGSCCLKCYQKWHGPDATGKPPAKSVLVTRRLSSIVPKPIKFLVPGYLPSGKVTMFAGDGGDGKSATMLDAIARGSVGEPCFGLDYAAPQPFESLLFTIEDGVEDTIIPRLIAAGADLNRVHHVDGIQGEKGVIPFNLEYFRQLELALQENRNIRLVVIDPAGGFISGRINDHKDTELRQLLQPLAAIADEMDVAIVLIKHLNKNAGVKAVHRISGSVAWVNTVRLAYYVGKDEDDPDLKFMIPIKGNVTKRSSGLKYRLVSMDPSEARDLLHAKAPGMPEGDAELLAKQMHRVQWEGETDQDANELSGMKRKAKDESASSVEAATAWLREKCNSYAWPCTELESMAAAEIKASSKAIWAARMALKGEGYFNQKVGFGADSAWWFGRGRRTEWTMRPGNPDEITP